MAELWKLTARNLLVLAGRSGGVGGVETPLTRIGVELPAGWSCGRLRQYIFTAAAAAVANQRERSLLRIPYRR